MPTKTHQNRVTADTWGMEIITEKLTKQEKVVMAHVGEGRTTKEIARLMRLSPHTVSSHVRSVCRKVDASGRWAALVQARRMGLMEK